MRGLDGKNVIVTGGGGAIGAAICRRFAGYGAHVGVFDKNLDGAKKVADEVKGVASGVDITDYGKAAWNAVRGTAASAMGFLQYTSQVISGDSDLTRDRVVAPAGGNAFGGGLAERTGSVVQLTGSRIVLCDAIGGAGAYGGDAKGGGLYAAPEGDAWRSQQIPRAPDRGSFRRTASARFGSSRVHDATF